MGPEIEGEKPELISLPLVCKLCFLRGTSDNFLFRHIFIFMDGSSPHLSRRYIENRAKNVPSQV